MATYKLEPNAEIKGAGTDGEEIVISFGEDGTVKVPDGFQEAHAILETARDVKRIKEK